MLWVMCLTLKVIAMKNFIKDFRSQKCMIVYNTRHILMFQFTLRMHIVALFKTV